MLSQCPHCHAIFNVNEPDIQAHHGLVRCGHCKAIFHAVINEVESTQLLSGEAAETNTLELPFDDTGSPARAPDPERERIPGSAPFLEPVPGSTPQRVAPASPTLESGELSEAGRDREAPPPDDRSQEQTDGPNEVTAGGEEAGRVGPVQPGARESADSKAGIPELADENVEEITIEAPPTLAYQFDAELRAAERAAAQPTGEAGDGGTDRAATGNRGPLGGDARAPKGQGPAAAEAMRAARTPFRSPYRAKDVQMVELPQPRPFKTASLSLLSIFLVLLLVWQVKTFYLDELAQVPLLRPYLDTLCRPLGCELPPRRDFARIELVGTSISINHEVPGALAITAGLLNNAHFPQPYPPLRVSLTDREGKVVGRRTYLPGEYGSRPNSGMLPIGEVREVTINLAQPDRDIVGYEVELVTPRSAGGV